MDARMDLRCGFEILGLGVRAVGACGCWLSRNSEAS